MSRSRRLVKAIKNFYRKNYQNSSSAIRKQSLRLLRRFLVIKRRRRTANAGFVLPTVAMVALVVVLLTTAILFRSFERSKSASNVRVNEAVLSAAAPAIERAKSKVDQLFKDPRLPRSTPSDFSLAQILNDSTNVQEYTFGDETPLKLVKDFNGTTGIQSEETLLSAWKYPVDTDNNGKFDSFTLYGIYYRTPTSTRARGVLEARAQPMDEGATSAQCASGAGTSADLVGSNGWYKVGSKLKRSIFAYTTTIPITQEPDTATFGSDNNKYEKFSGNKGFVALEYQQDRERIPLSNNAVIYENDLEITSGADLNLNGRVFTNGNLLTRVKPVSKGTQNTIRYYLVSSPTSCYYTQENSKIVVAGNVISTSVDESSFGTNKTDRVVVDLFAKPLPTGNAPTQENINDTNKTTTQYGTTAAFNDEAYAQRIKRLVEATNAAITNNADLPDEVYDRIKGITDSQKLAKARDEQLKIWFRKRTRRVPYAEVGAGGDAVKTPVDYTTTSPLIRTDKSGTNDKNALRPKNEWVFPFDPSDGKTEAGYANVKINLNGTKKLHLTAADPAEQAKAGKELKIGDRVLVGNGLPQYWYDTTKGNGKFVSSEEGQAISGIEWDVDKDGKDTTVARKRYTQAYQLDDLGVTDRDDFWETQATKKPESPLDAVGGLRVVTGAGIYLPNSFTANGGATQFSSAITSTTALGTVWADTMPFGVTTQSEGLPDDKTPYLRMRATVVYHYQKDIYDSDTDTQTPLACVSSYYDPTSSTTALNSEKDFKGNTIPVPPSSPISTSTLGKSNNGIVYPASSLGTTGYLEGLKYQATLKYPNGRWVNEPLKNAVDKINAAKNLTLAEQSAVDSAVCALKIFDGTIGAPTNTDFPHGAIKETAFLDARQIKAIDKSAASKKTYDLDVELRQPLEIRATVIDLAALKKQIPTASLTINTTTPEFLFPNSGIIYATRDDALVDASDPNDPNGDKELSSTDFILDPTRRPNGIMLINGSDLSRNNTYKAEEKGLILASNLPVYIKGDFNKHTKEEFSDKLLKGASSWGDFYKRVTKDTSFACRPNQFGTGTCSSGETWRSATVLADAITVLSENFKDGYREDGDYDLRVNNDTLDKSLSPVFIPFDVNGDGDILDNSDETKLGFDLNGNGNATDTAVPETPQIITSPNNGITASAAAKINGFWDNNFVTSHNFTDTTYSSGKYVDGTGTDRDSSYFNNFVTPIQRRVTFSEYVMEICPKLTVIACKPGDWVVGYDLDGNNSFSTSEKNIKANQLVKALTDGKITNVDPSKLRSGTTATPAKDSSDPAIQRYPRRVAFLRYPAASETFIVYKDGETLIRRTENNLVLGGNNTSDTPVPLGIADDGKGVLSVQYFPLNDSLNICTDPLKNCNTDPKKPSEPLKGITYSKNKLPRTQANTLWFRTNSKINTLQAASINYDPIFPLWIQNLSKLTGQIPTEQPLLIPVLQIQYPFSSPKGDGKGDNNVGTGGCYGTPPVDPDVKKCGNWMQTAKGLTETNLIFTGGNTPGRPNETNGGLENFVRYLERWQNTEADTSLINHIATGAFIQFKRSSYATAPWQAFTGDSSIFNKTTESTFGYVDTKKLGYPQQYSTTTNQGSGTTGRSPFYTTPTRSWGYDVALLSQSPDLFSQRFTSPPTNDPNEFYREVGRDDAWVKTLLCAAQSKDVKTGVYEDADATTYGTDQKYAVSSNQRPACP
jgi:hypothetical protein